MHMTLTPQTFLIVCPLIFLAGFVDAIGGGGGLISLPAYLLAGVPVHQAIATNKLSSACGTALATARFIKKGLVNWHLAVPTIGLAMLGSSLGANASLAMEEGLMEKILIFVLPVAAAIVLNPRLFRDHADGEVKLDIRKIWKEFMGILMILVWAWFGNTVYDAGYNWFFIETSIFPFLSDEIMPVMVVASVFGVCLAVYGAYYGMRKICDKKLPCAV